MQYNAKQIKELKVQTLDKAIQIYRRNINITKSPLIKEIYETEIGLITNWKHEIANTKD